MSEEHRKRAIEGYLYLHSEQPVPPAKLIEARHWEPRPEVTTGIEEDPGPERYSTGPSPDEGLWTRKGWAGRT